jgi:hypothetical protein
MTETKTNVAASAPTGQAPVSPMTKVEAVRQAMAKLGKKAPPLKIKDYLKKHFQMDVSRDLISKYKGELTHKPAKKTVRKEPAAPKTLPAPTGNNSKGILLEDLRTAKVLVQRVGVEKLRTLIDVLTR